MSKRNEIDDFNFRRNLGEFDRPNRPQSPGPNGLGGCLRNLLIAGFLIALLGHCVTEQKRQEFNRPQQQRGHLFYFE